MSSSQVAVPRHGAAGVSVHPQFLSLDGNLELVLVDDEVCGPLFFGLSTVGWAGDHALAVYSWPRRNAFVLMRLEVDGVYRVVRQLNSDRPLAPGQINALCSWLVAHDRERGFDPHTAVTAHNDRVDAERRQREEEWIDEEMAPRMEHAIKRDLGQHLGGVHFDHAVGDVPWHDSTGAVSAEKE